MSSTSPALPPRRPFNAKAWLPRGPSLWWVAAAVVIGALLFLWALPSKEERAFYRAGPAAPDVQSPDYVPLPAPMAGAREDSASGLGETSRDAPRTGASERSAELIETRPMAPPPELTPAAPPAPPAPASQPIPLAGSTPAPRYPPASLRRGESGTVVVEARVDPRGNVSAVNVADGSGSRLLDRAAMDAVRRWRFEPARSNGEPVAATVRVPIEFSPNR